MSAAAEAGLAGQGMPRGATVIDVAQLTKRYGAATVVDNITFTVGKGEIFGVLGPNGAGKTTTILMLLGLSDITSGQARVLGFDPVRQPLEVKRRVGYLPDSVGFYDHLSAAENLRYTGRLMNIEHNDRERRIAAAMERVGLGAVQNKRVATFSRGMRQRLGLAEILMKQSEIAILDEPTSGLDPQATNELLETIRELKREGVTIVLSSHLLDRVQSICDRVALFHGGRIALMGSVSELGREILGGGFSVDVEATGVGLAEEMRQVPGVRSVEEREFGFFRLTAERDVRADVARAVTAAGAELRSLAIEAPSLEAIYANYFQSPAGKESRDAA
jgi:ABC-2 type transport system ATP-binding protein